MLYVSSFDRRRNMYGVTDTDDGAIDYYTKDALVQISKTLAKSGIKIDGVAGSQVRVVSLTSQVMGVGFAKAEKQVEALIAGWSEETCMEIARGASFVKKIKGQPIDEMRRITKSYIYPDSIRSAVQNAAQYTNQFREVDVRDRGLVMQALMSNVCLVLQHKTNGVLTSFVCTASIGVVDSIYGKGFFDGVYLTKQLYGYTYNANKLKPRTNRPSQKNLDLVNVFSCSLRFRNDGKYHDNGNMVLSSPFYTVNLGRLFSLYILDNPARLGDTITAEFQRSQHTGVYDFDFDMFRSVMMDVSGGANTFNATAMQRYMNNVTLGAGVTMDDIADRYDRDFKYMKKLRSNGCSFVRED